MKAKVKRGNGFRGVLEYVFGPGQHNQPGRAEIVGGNLSGMHPRELAAEFGASRRQRPEVKNPVWHCSLALPKGERLDSAAWHQVCQRHLQLMGIDTDNHMWIAVRHADTDHDHVHVVVSRIGLNAALWHGRNDVKAAIESTQTLEREFGLLLTPGLNSASATERPRETKGEAEKKKRTGVSSTKERIQAILNKAMQGGDFKRFVEACQAAGLDLLPNLASTGRMNGFSFRLDGEVMKASALGSKYKWDRLASKLGFDPAVHLSLVQALAGAASAHKEVEPDTILQAVWVKEPKQPQRRNRTIDLLFVRFDDGTYTWKKSQAPAFTDLGDRIRFERSPDAAVKAALQLAHEKGWAEVVAAGAIDFRRRAWLQGQLLGLKVTGYDPTETDLVMLAERRCALATRMAQKERDPLIRQILILKAQADAAFAIHRAVYGEIPSTEIIGDTIQPDQQKFVERHADESYERIKREAAASWAALKKVRKEGMLSKLFFGQSDSAAETKNTRDWSAYLSHCERFIAATSAARTRLMLQSADLIYLLHERRAGRMPAELQDALDGKPSAKPHMEALAKVMQVMRQSEQRAGPAQASDFIRHDGFGADNREQIPASDLDRSEHRLR
jgi:hypothetical protein